MSDEQLKEDNPESSSQRELNNEINKFRSKAEDFYNYIHHINLYGISHYHFTYGEKANVTEQKSEDNMGNKKTLEDGGIFYYWKQHNPPRAVQLKETYRSATENDENTVLNREIEKQDDQRHSFMDAIRRLKEQ